MGRHKGNAANEPVGTTTGKPFDQMSGEEKAAEFEASAADPVGYAERNFPAAQSGNMRTEPVQPGREYPDPNAQMGQADIFRHAVAVIMLVPLVGAGLITALRWWKER